VAGVAAVGVDDYFAAGETGVALGASDDEATSGVDVPDGGVVQPFQGNHLVDDVPLDVVIDLFVGRVLGVLNADQDVVHPSRAAVGVVFDSHLGLAVGPRPAQGSVTAFLTEPPGQAVGELDRRRHQLRGLVAGEAEHHSLVARAAGVDPLRDIRRLLVDADEHPTGLVIEPVLGTDVADVLDGPAHNPGDVDVGVGGDLAEDQRGAGGEGRLAGHPSQRILLEDGVEDGIADLIGDLVGMTFGHRLRGEQTPATVTHKGSSDPTGGHPGRPVRQRPLLSGIGSMVPVCPGRARKPAARRWRSDT